MHCEYFRCTMRSAVCLEYQARARGKTNGNHLPNMARAGHWQIKYKPCVDCAQGKQIKKNGGDDSDVEALKNKASETKYCKHCDQDKPINEFYEIVKDSGRYTGECKQCTKERVNRQAKEKRQALKGVADSNTQSPRITEAQPAVLSAAPTSEIYLQPPINPGNPWEPVEQPVINEKHEIVGWEPVKPSGQLTVKAGADLPAELPPGEIKTLPTKICTRCRNEKPLTDFQRYRSNPDGRDRRCKQCKAELKLLQKPQSPDQVLSVTVSGPVYDRLFREASKELRSVENQAAWVLREWYTGGLHAAER